MEKEIIRRKIISEETKDKMVELYSTKEVTSKQALADMFHMTKKRCSEILAEKNVTTINSWERTKVIPIIDGEKYISTDEYTFIAKHKETGKEFKDYKNVSGRLTTYLVELNPNFEIPTQIFKKRYYQTSGNYWHEQFYDIIKTPIIIKKMKGELYDSEIKEIIRLYSTGEVSSKDKLAAMFKIGKLKVLSILEENGVEINKRGGQEKEVKKVREPDPLKLPTKYVETEDIVYKAVCKKTGLIFDDYLNKSGALTRHLLTQYSDIVIERSRVTNKYYSNNGVYWYEQYFDIKPFDKPKMRKCDYCDWEMPLDVSERQYKMHLTMQHHITIKEHLEKYPSDNELFKDDFDKIELEKDDDNWVICAICGKKMKTVNSGHLRKHGLIAAQYRKKHGNNISLSFHNTLSLSAIAINSSGVTGVKESKPELEIKNYIRSLGFDAVSNRSILNGKEIDILIEEKKLGIEFNGNKWHGEWNGGKDKDYHLNKTILANEKGYNLIHIFEDEWENNKKIVINRINYLLGKNEELPRVAGRKTIIKEIKKRIVTDFLNKFHIQGSVDYTLAFGAYHEDILIGVMTFKVTTKNTSEYELSRFTTDYNYICQGIGSKLLTYFIDNYKPTSIISFADRRWTLNKDNNLYTKMGFSLDNVTKPDYRYYNSKVDRYERFHRSGFNKEKLCECNSDLSMDMTETEMMKQLGYDRIWDCGLFKYKLDLN